MVVFVDLGEGTSLDGTSQHQKNGYHTLDGERPRTDSFVQQAAVTHEAREPEENTEQIRENPNREHGFCAILSCYPIVSQLASLLDLNDLDALALTCRQFRANLLEYRRELVKLTMRCSNEADDLGTRLADRVVQSRMVWNGLGGSSATVGRIQSGRISRCARDMVGECRKCGVVVCRNCVIKPPTSSAFNGRHRRICKTCQKAPVELLTTTQENDEFGEDNTIQTLTPDGNLRLARRQSENQYFTQHDVRAAELRNDTVVCNDKFAIVPLLPTPSFTSVAFTRRPCSCVDRIYLCHPCGRTLRANDDTYMHGWKWRTHYSMNGLGVGIGEGHEGVTCGRRRACLAVREVETEVECSADEVRELERGAAAAGGSGTPVGEESTVARARSPETGAVLRSWEGSSYLSQEMEGVGGGLKMKVRKAVLVGAVVKEYEHERGQARFLDKERSRQVRSWCAWCERVILSVKDEQAC